MDTSHIYIVIPAKDEATRIGGVLSHIRQLGYSNIIVVDDGSTDITGAVARSMGAVVLTHLVNLGAGAATQTGIEYALRRNAKIIVTIDADHQHLPADIDGLVQTLQEKKVDIVLGSRFFGNNDAIPHLRVFYNKIANELTWLFTGLRVNDSQSGMKAFRAEFARRATITRNGFEFCIEIIQQIRLLKATWAESPIGVVYTKDTMSKGQGFLTGLKTLLNMMRFYV